MGGGGGFEGISRRGSWAGWDQPLGRLVFSPPDPAGPEDRPCALEFLAFSAGVTAKWLAGGPAAWVQGAESLGGLWAAFCKLFFIYNLGGIMSEYVRI